MDDFDNNQRNFKIAGYNEFYIKLVLFHMKWIKLYSISGFKQTAEKNECLKMILFEISDISKHEWVEKM